MAKNSRSQINSGSDDSQLVL